MKVVRPPALTEQKYRTTRGITGGLLLISGLFLWHAFVAALQIKSRKKKLFQKVCNLKFKTKRQQTGMYSSTKLGPPRASIGKDPVTKTE